MSNVRTSNKRSAFGDVCVESSFFYDRLFLYRRIDANCCRRHRLCNYHSLANLAKSWHVSISRFSATVCKTVRPMLSDRCLSCPALSVCLSCLWRWCIVAKRFDGLRCCWYGGRPRPGHIVLDVDPAPSTERGTASPTFRRPMSIMAKRSPISATAELLLLFV